MRVLSSKALALTAAAILVLSGCGGSSAPNPVDPVGGVAAAFDTAKSGGVLKAMDLVTCLTTGGAIGSAFSGLLGGLTGDALAKAGISAADLSAAWTISFDNLQTSQTSLSGNQATVHVSVKVTSAIDAGRLRDLVKKYGATQGIVPDDATIDAAIKAKLGGQTTMSETITKDISVVQQNGQWVACGGALGTAAAGATGAAGAAGAAPATGYTAAPTQAAVATETPTSGAPASTPTSTAPGPVGSPAAGNVTAISSGSGYTCALLTDGSVMCWGDNYNGELGIGTKSGQEATTPVRVTGLTSGITAIAASQGYVCALTSAGGVKCWGTNQLGGLGNGSMRESLSPVDVFGLTSGVVAISAGYGQACAVTSSGGVKCWGSFTGSSIPVDVAGLASGVTAIATSKGGGDAYTCALTTAGGVKCWGGNTVGQLGNGTTAASKTPVDVAGLTSGVTAIAVGAGYSCAVIAAGGVKCWGGKSSVAVDVAGLTSGVTAVALDAQSRACAVTTGGGVKCWDSLKPTPVDDPSLTSGVTRIDLGNRLCALMNTGGVKCLDSNNVGYVDITGLTLAGTGTQAPSPSAPPAAGNVTAIAAGGQHICAITSGGGVKCWGNNGSGQLGNGTAISSATPVDVFGLQSGVTAIAAGANYTCALTSTRGVKCWGANSAGQLGNGSTTGSLIPVDVSGLASGVAAIAVGDSSSIGRTCALTTSGGVKCWGAWNPGASKQDPAPVDIPGLASGITALTAGGGQTCALTTNGGVKCWGTDDGTGLPTGSTTAVDVPGLNSGITAIAAGTAYSCALTGAGGVKCWGRLPGQVGVAPTSAFIQGLTNGVTAIAAGPYKACALTSVGGVRCWGNGNLGDGKGVGSAVPVDVAGLSSGATAIAVGDAAACAITSGGGVKCWGGGSALGNPTVTDATTPVDVAGL